jgi:virulence factor Mce-like protein
MRGKAGAITGSPVLIGAVTTLVTLVAVFLAYNANKGLPFVPTYDISAELPNGEKLVAGNEVRIGGFRVGVIADLSTKTVERDGEPMTIAVAQLKIDKSAAPLARDTETTVRNRSALGLKYLQLEPGDSDEMIRAGGILPLENANATVDFEEVLGTFDAPTRRAARAALVGYGDAFAGRGEELNRSIVLLAPFLDDLTHVMRVLSDPATELDRLFVELGQSAAQVAPVADVQAALFGHIADTMAAFSRNPERLRQTIERSPETLDTAIRSFRVQQPFLREATALSRELQPATAALPRTLPRLNRALAVGIPVLERVPELSEQSEQVLRAVDDLAEEPSTSLALRDLDRTVRVGGPLAQFVAPYQTVCNYWNYWWTNLSEHLSEPVRNGTTQRVMLVLTNHTQDNRLGDSTAERPADVPANLDPQTAKAEDGEPLTKLNTQFQGRVLDENGNADCQAGQTGYPDGPLITGGRYPPDTSAGGFQGGGSHVVIDPDLPGNAGGTYVTRRLGIDNVEDVE